MNTIQYSSKLNTLPLYIFYQNGGQTREKKLLEICQYPDTNWGFCSWRLVLYHYNILNMGRLVLVLFQGKVSHNLGDR